MSAFQLPNFAPASREALGRVSDTLSRLEAVREEAYGEGYLAGQAAATEVMLADDARLSSDLIEAINDARLSTEAARRHVSASLVPMIEALYAAITPALAEAGLISEIGRLVARAIEAAPGARPHLRVAPELAPVVGALLAGRGIEAVVEEGPELLPREARVFWDQGYDHLDLDACIDQVRACLSAHLDPKAEDDSDESRNYG